MEQIPIAALEHAAYCERQWALIHINGFFASNDDTVRGDHVHERVDRTGGQRRGDLRTEWRLPVWSDRIGIYGYCDAVEFEADRVTPIEYKSGKRCERPAEVQVCAQAMCLEEMLEIEITEGIVYLVAPRTSVTVELNTGLRTEVVALAKRLRTIVNNTALPAPRNDSRCPGCSLSANCLPGLVADRRKVSGLHGATWQA